MPSIEDGWDTKTQEVHGGQTWRHCRQFHADFSVTTNALPPPSSAVVAATAALDTMHHYPPADGGDARTALAELCDWPVDDLAVGNGASEFIDLIMRLAPPGPFRPGPFAAAYREYDRAARVSGRKILSPHGHGGDDDGENAAVTVLIRPNSPTGELLSLQDVEDILQKSNGVVVIDESFLPFAGTKWGELSARRLVARWAERLVVINSWTKIWSCAGLRLGSILAAPYWMERIRASQTPWSCSGPAQAFAVAAARDETYLPETWKNISEWRVKTVELIKSVGWEVEKRSVDWIPWVFVKCPSESVAQRAVRAAQEAGCPVRPCGSYGLGDHVRVAVREPKFQKILLAAWRTLADE